MRIKPARITLLLAAFLTTAAAGQEPASPPRERSEIVQVAREVMVKTRYCTLVTVGEDGHPQARVMDPFVPEDDMTVWMATNVVTRKARQIRADPRVTLLYFDPEDPAYVTLIGTAVLVDDPHQKARYWKEDWSEFYKDESRGDDYILIRFTPRRMETISNRHRLLNDPETWHPVSVDF